MKKDNINKKIAKKPLEVTDKLVWDQYVKTAKIVDNIDQESLLKFANEIGGKFQEFVDFQTSASEFLYREGRKLEQVVNNIAVNLRLLEIPLAKALEYEKLNGLIVQSNFKRYETSNLNGVEIVSELTHIETSKSDTPNLVTIGIQTKKTTNTPIIYQNNECTNLSIEFLNEEFQALRNEISALKEQTKNDSKLILDYLKNKGDFIFQIHNIIYRIVETKFIVNDQIGIQIPSNTRYAKLCNVLFSDRDEDLVEEWIIDDIKEKWSEIDDFDTAEKLSWKEIKQIMDRINELVAMKTTHKDIILRPRENVVQLNPQYFKTL